MKCSKEVLSNGLRLLLIPDTSLPTATVMALVSAGSKFETKDINGLSHFLEHMCFKGTTNRPGPRLIAEELDSLGAQYNAFTGQEYTGYYAKVAASKVSQALDIVADLYLNPLFDGAEIEREKGVIVEEMHMYEDMPNRRVQDDIMAVLYPNQPAGWSIIGEKEFIARATREDFVKYRSEHYLPQATVVVVSGNIDVSAIRARVAELFGSMPGGSKSDKMLTVVDQSAPRAAVRFKQSDQSHAVLAWHGYALSDDRSYPARVLGTILGGTMSSRLWQRVREELGAAYYVRAFHDPFSDHGVFQIAAGLDTKRLSLVLGVMMEEVRRMVKEPVSEVELARAKDSIVGNFLMGLERSDDLAEYYGLQEVLLGESITPEEYVSKISQVGSVDISRVAAELFTTAHSNLAVIGPHRDSDEFVPLLSV